MSESQNTYSMESLKNSGLSDQEAKILSSWVEAGKPGVSRLKADSFGKLYELGYSCQDIHDSFPEYSIEILLYARVMYKWDQARELHRNRVSSDLVASATNARAESIKFMTEILGATHAKWRSEIMEYIANPTRSKVPECIPNSLHQYGNLLKLLQDIVSPGAGASKKAGSEGDMSKSTPLVSVNINNGSGSKDTVVEVSQADVKNALIRDVGPKNE